jgi:intein/homing endonuclease
LITENGVERLVNTKHLKLGDLMVKPDGTIERLDTISIVTAETPTFNFVVDGNHLYVAEGIVVHNPSTVQKF